MRLLVLYLHHANFDNGNSSTRKTPLEYLLNLQPFLESIICTLRLEAGDIACTQKYQPEFKNSPNIFHFLQLCDCRSMILLPHIPSHFLLLCFLSLDIVTL